MARIRRGHGGRVADAFAGAALRPLRGGLPGACWGCGMSETQGPWEVQRGSNEIFGMGWDITPPSGVRGQFQYEADARKAAAAPDLLAACEWMLEHCDQGGVVGSRTMRHWRRHRQSERGKRHEPYGSEPAHGSVGQRYGR